jgi:hypothetical protein
MKRTVPRGLALSPWKGASVFTQAPADSCPAYLGKTYAELSGSGSFNVFVATKIMCVRTLSRIILLTRECVIDRK